MGKLYTHDITVTIPANEYGDTSEIVARLHYTVDFGSPARLFGRPEDCHPGSAASAELDRIEVSDDDGKTFRPAVGACYPDSNDQHAMDAAEDWFADNEDTLIAEAAEEERGRIGYAAEMKAEWAAERAAERRMEA